MKLGEWIETIGRYLNHNRTTFGFSTETSYLPLRKATVVFSAKRLDADDISQSTLLFLKLAKIAFPKYASS